MTQSLKPLRFFSWFTLRGLTTREVQLSGPVHEEACPVVSNVWEPRSKCIGAWRASRVDPAYSAVYHLLAKMCTSIPWGRFCWLHRNWITLNNGILAQCSIHVTKIKTCMYVRTYVKDADVLLRRKCRELSVQRGLKPVSLTHHFKTTRSTVLYQPSLLGLVLLEV